MRLIDADELMEHIGRDKLDSRESIMKMVENTPTTRWHPITEKPSRSKDLMLKIYDKRNLFYYYHMGFYSAGKYLTYNFCWQYDEDLEVVGWQLCPWEGE